MVLLRIVSLSFVLAGVPVLAQGPHVQTTEPLPAAEQIKGFHLPPGFEIQLVAAEPDIQKPLNLNWDSRGRLWVTHTIEYPYAAKSDEVARDGVTILDQLDSAGRAHSIHKFADQLNIPIGIQPVPGGAISFSIPKISRLGDTDGDDMADTRHVMFTGFDFRDTHGLQNSFRRWIDGWVYANHAYANQSEIPTPEGKKLAMSSGNTYRFTIDGGKIEQLTNGQVNPFGMTFDPLGNRFTADCHSKPVYMLLRGGHYPSFGKPHDGLGFAPEMIKHTHGSTAISGISYYAADHFPEEYRNNLFIGNVVTRCVNRDKLAVHGSSYEAEEQEDFVTCDDPWFRPVDVRMGPDGALYIADFYNRIIGHYEVPLEHPGRDRHRGRVWRVVYKGTEGQAAELPQPMADLSQLSVSELLLQLDAKNLLVRTLATNEIVDRFQQTAVVLVQQMMRDSDASDFQKTHGLWILHRLGALDSQLVARLRSEPNRMVRTHLIQAIAERPNWTATEDELAQTMLTDSDSFVRRAVVDAMSRHPKLEFIDPLLKCWDTANRQDTHLIHMCKIALRNHLLLEGAYQNISSNKELSARHRAHLTKVSLAVRNSSSARFLLKFLPTHDEDLALVDSALAHVARHCAQEQLADFLGYLDTFRKHPDLARQAAVLRIVLRGLQIRGKPTPEPQRVWALQLIKKLLQASEPEHKLEGIRLAQQIKSVEVYEQVAKLMNQKSQTMPVRLAALRAANMIDSPRSIDMLCILLAEKKQPKRLRAVAANLLAQNSQLETARNVLLKQLAQSAEPLKLPIAIALSSSSHGASALLDTIEQGSAPADLLQNATVSALLLRSGFSKKEEIDRRIRSIKGEAQTTNTPREDQSRKLPSAETRQRIEKLVAGYKSASPEVARGKEVFTKNCANCHRIQEAGNQVGPQLDGIGLRGIHKILEDLVDPNLNVDPNFQMSLVVLTTGKVVTGLSQGTQDQELLLIDSLGKEIRILEEEIEEINKLEVSPMPANFVEVLPENDLYDLLAFLITQKHRKMTL